MSELDKIVLSPEDYRFAKDVWIPALRSGEYKQGQKCLRQLISPFDEEYVYCCLGVACDLHPDVTWSPDGVCHPGGPTQDGGAGYVTAHVAFFGSLNQRRIAAWNDTGMCFNTIADILEAEIVEKTDD